MKLMKQGRDITNDEADEASHSKTVKAIAEYRDHIKKSVKDAAAQKFESQDKDGKELNADNHFDRWKLKELSAQKSQQLSADDWAWGGSSTGVQNASAIQVAKRLRSTTL